MYIHVGSGHLNLSFIGPCLADNTFVVLTLFILMGTYIHDLVFIFQFRELVSEYCLTFYAIDLYVHCTTGTLYCTSEL